jgi:hypothetical protein
MSRYIHFIKLKYLIFPNEGSRSVWKGYQLQPWSGLFEAAADWNDKKNREKAASESRYHFSSPQDVTAALCSRPSLATGSMAGLSKTVEEKRAEAAGKVGIQSSRLAMRRWPWLAWVARWQKPAQEWGWRAATGCERRGGAWATLGLVHMMYVPS